MQSLTLFLFPLLLFLLLGGFPVCRSELRDPVPDISNTSLLFDFDGGDEESSKNNYLPVPIASPSSKYILLHVFSNHDTVLIASLDGMIYLVERNSRKVRWSFSTGPALYSSYHPSPEDDYFIECGDDGNLYEQSNYFGRRKLSKTIEEYVNSPPRTFNGALTFGHKILTIFLIDLQNGSILHTFTPHDSQLAIDVRNDEQSLISKQEMGDLLASSSLDITASKFMFTREDFILQSVDFISKELLWKTTVAKINAISLSQDSENEDSENERRSLEYKGDAYPSLDGYKGDAYPSLDGYKGDAYPSLDGYLDQLRSSCEVENNCLMEIDDDGKQIVSGIFVEATILSLIVVVAVICCLRQFRKVKNSNQQPNHLNGKQTVNTKKRKARQKGNYKNIADINKQDNHMTSDNDDPGIDTLTNAKINGTGSLSNRTKVDEDCDGRWVGKLFVSNKEIAKGSNGTVVFEGIVYDDQHPEGIVYDLQHPVAVKRLVLAHNDVAFKEIKILRESKHSNIVHLYGVERDLDFVYIALERCTCSLNDLIQLYSDASLNLQSTRSPISNSRGEYNVRLESSVGIDKSINLWEANGYPSPQLLKLMRDVVFGLTHLHELGIIHRDLKPHNVLISSGKSLCAKLADMGISKRLHSGMSSLGHQVTGNGSSGWQAPEQLLHGRQTRAMDLFSLGCLLFFCITQGRHPFGDYLERDANIAKNEFDLFLVEHIPEAVDLLSHLLDHNPEKRPKAEEVLHHPLFWSSEKHLLFLQDASDRVELADRVGDSDLLKALENVASVALNGNWNEKLEARFIDNIGNYRRYKYNSVRDLLRLIRNKSSHYIDLPQEVQELVGPYPDGCYDYFARRFPKLLIEAYKVIHLYCRDEILFRKYFKCDLTIR